MSQEAIERRAQFNSESEVRLTGRILWLTKDPNLIRRQIEGENFAFIPQEELAENISTDEIIPSKYCLYFTPEELGDFALTSFRGGVIQPGDIKNGGFEALVAGTAFGGGSFREHAPISLKGAGIKFIAASPIVKGFLANSQNQGLYPIENPKTLAELLQNKRVEKGEIAASFDPISAEIIRAGGLLPYLAARREGQVKLPEIKTPKRPQTLVEKIIAAHIVTNGSVGVEAVKPGDAGFIKSDLTYSYEIMTPLAESALIEEFGENCQIKDKQSIILFEDHTALAETLKQNPETAPLVAKLLTSQRQFAKRNQIQLYPPNVGICHNHMVETHALPGRVIAGTDSHTCSLGAVGAFAFGIGATEMAGAWLTGDVRVTVPPTWRFNFKGKLAENAMAKDVMLAIFAKPEFQKGAAVGRVLEYAGDALNFWSFDELFVLANMAVEGEARTGIVEPNEVIINYLLTHHSDISQKDLEDMAVKSDPTPEIFEKIFDIDLGKIPLMVATPGDPRNSVPLADVAGQKANAVYVGSCTAGKDEDLLAFDDMLPDGKEVKIPTFVQASSGGIQDRVEKIGLFKKFKRARITILGAGCGDCCNLGRGIAGKGEIIISATNRNFPNRMGPADVFLVNPRVAAVTAILGRLPTPEEVYRFSKAA